MSLPARSLATVGPLLVAALVLATGCEEGTTLLVDLRTDFAPGIEFREVRTEYSREPFAAAGVRQSVEVAAEAGSDYARRGARVATFGGLRPGAAFVRVSLIAADGRVVADRVVTAATQRRTVMVVVVSRSCLGIDCPGEGDDPAAVACLAGRCVPEECTLGNAESCGEGSCAADGDCRAEADCAVGLCLESECFLVGDHARCGSGEWCSPELGCLPLETSADGGPPDAGVSDASSCAASETACGDGLDDDCDGDADCLDPDCSGATCDDGSDCTTDDRCGSDGSCGGDALPCDDGNPCTIDSCDAALGCVHDAMADDPAIACDDGDACTTGDQCVAGTCTGAALSCDDGNPCTDDACDPASGCSSTANTASCDDGLYCNGPDVCSGGTCTRPSPPCATFCNETTDACEACGSAADCGTAPPPTAWAPATCAFATTCGETAPDQTRTVYAVACMAGMCVTTSTTESQPCTRDTDGTECYRDEGFPCAYSSTNTCDETASRTITRRFCAAGVCPSSGGTTSGTTSGCPTRDRSSVRCFFDDGFPCSYGGPCDEQASRTTVARFCSGGSCPSSGGDRNTTTSGCQSRNTDGNRCGMMRNRDRCCNGGCRDIYASEAHCGGCGQQCESGTTCRIISAGATAGDGAECGICTANSQCDAPGGSRNCYSTASGGYGYCQCLDNSGCAPGQTCRSVTGSNYCTY